MKTLLLRQLLFVLTSFLGISLISYFLYDIGVSSGNDLQINYLDYLGQVLQGNMGTTKLTAEPALDSFLRHLPASMELVLLATFFALLVGIPLGVIAAKNHRSFLDIVINNLAITAYSMPIFWWAIILIVYLSLNWDLTPVAGRLDFIYDIESVTGFMLIDTYISEQPYRIEAFWDAVGHLILPVLTLGTLPAAIISRMTRQTMLNTLNQDYIKTARAKGLSQFRIYWIHGLRNALLPLTNMLSLQISTLMTGAMITEYIFAWPGIGKWLIDSVLQADFTSLATGLLITATMVILINAALELIGLWLNPKKTHSERIYHG